MTELPFIKSYFDHTQLILLCLGGLSFGSSLIFHTKNKSLLSVLFLGFTAFFIFSFAALLDPFLNLWDERFHALAAKNLLYHPFKFTLYDDPIVKMAYDRWDRYHIWLHKQPLFLWQIAASFKLFGLSEFALRLPNVILGTVLVLATYRSGKLLVNDRVGYIAGVLIITSIYILELIGGRQELEHNDFTFLVYISLSIWAYIEYHFTSNKRWIFFIGLFAGMAILCKWLVGLLVYFAWFILRVLEKKIKLTENKDYLIALLITILIAAPWQIFIFLKYPVEAASAYKFNMLHFTIPLEGHEGTFWYHFDRFNSIYGVIASYLIIPSLFLLYQRMENKKLYYSLLSMLCIVYLFFSIVATKMPSFVTVVCMIIFIAFATLLDSLLSYISSNIKSKKYSALVFVLSLIILSFARLDLELLQEKHTLWKEDNQYSRMLIQNKSVFNSLHLNPKTVLFNVKGRHYIEAMYYTGLPAYNFIPSFEQYQDVKSKGRMIALFNSNQTEIPDYLKSDSSIIYIQKELTGFE